jgi:serine/threonine protein kinase
MAPEVLNGADIDARADLFALGVTAYWLLTGMRPFRGPSDTAVMRAILADQPAPPSSLNPGLPGWIDDVVMGLLEKDPARRTASGALVAGEIERRSADALDRLADVAFVSELFATNVPELAESPEPVPAERRSPAGYLGDVDDLSFEFELATELSAALPRSSLSASAASSSERTARGAAPGEVTRPAPAPAPITFPTERGGDVERTMEDDSTAEAPVREGRVDAAPVAVARASPVPRVVSVDLHVDEPDDPTGDTLRLTESQLGIMREELATEPKRPAFDGALPADGPTVRQVPSKKGRRRG